MAGQINLQPQTLDLALYAGDGVEFRLVCTNTAGAPIDVTGTIKAQIRLERLTPDPPVAQFGVNSVDAYQGIIVLSLTEAQTQDLVGDSGKFNGVWDIQWAPATGQPRTLCQGKVECEADVTR
jgi:hypothetical protein